MKDKVLVFIIGLLLGAVITAAGFLVFEKVNKNVTPGFDEERMQMMERPDGQMPEGGENDETRPEPPSQDNEM